jgi:hypothetical protein
MKIPSKQRPSMEGPFHIQCVDLGKMPNGGIPGDNTGSMGVLCSLFSFQETKPE